jgi:drug/metabolite transporter (DMT)-like permease
LISIYDYSFYLLAICGALDQLFITLSLKLENAGPISVVRALSVVFSFIFSVTILDEKIRWTSFAGGALIFISIVIMGTAKWYKDSKEDNLLKKNCEEANNNPKLVNFAFYSNNNNDKY